MDQGEEEVKDEEIEEETIVFANFEEGAVDKDIFQNSELKFKVIGLDSKTPIVQLGSDIFKGSWNDTIGTKVFFDEDFSPEQIDPVFTILPPRMLKYKCTSTKTLELSRIFLKPKSAIKMNDENDVKTIDDSDCEEKPQVSHLIQSTINPSSDAVEVMDSIVAETVMEL